MSTIQDEIDRIEEAKEEIKTWANDNGAEITDESLSDFPTILSTQIQVGGETVYTAADYDLIITTQTEFDEMVESDTWLDAVSVAIIGDGGTMTYTHTDGIKIPDNVKVIKGVKNPVIEVIDFVYSTSTSRAGLAYGSQKYPYDGYLIDGITLNVSTADTSTGLGYGTYYLGALKNCIITVTAYRTYAVYYTQLIDNCKINCMEKEDSANTSLSYGIGYSYNVSNTVLYTNSRLFYGYYYCYYLSNCTGTYSPRDTNSGASSNIGMFYYCYRMVNCYVVNSNYQEITAMFVGFRYCQYLTNCWGTLTNAPNASAVFNNCSYLTNCFGTATRSFNLGSDKDSNDICQAYSACNYLNNCYGVATKTVDASGSATLTNEEGNVAKAFRNCNYLTNCVGRGVNTTATSSLGYSFAGCSKLSNCGDTGTVSSTALLGEVNTYVDSETVAAT